MFSKKTREGIKRKNRVETSTLSTLNIYYNMEEISKKEVVSNSPLEKQEQIIPVTENNFVKELENTNLEITRHQDVVSNTIKEINLIRVDLGLSGEKTDIPSIESDKKQIVQLENKKIQLEKKLQELLKFDVSEKYKDIIDKVKKSKIDWAHSDELARRLKLRGATGEDVVQVKNWLINNTNNAKTFILPSDTFKNVVDVLREMTGEDGLQEGQAFHVSGGRTDVPEYITSSVFMKETPAKPPIPGQEYRPAETIDTNVLQHEVGHVAQDGLLDSELYGDWKPTFKEGAPDKEYVGLIYETDTRIRSMFRDLGETFDPKKEVFGKKHLEILRDKLTKGQLDQDTKDLFSHYDDATIMKFANRLPAI